MLCHRSFLTIAAFSALLAACSSSPDHRVERLEIDGVPLVRTSGGPKYNTPLLRLESDLILGIDEGEPDWQLFSRSPQSLIAPDGSMVLVDGQRFEVFIVSHEGQLLQRFGRKGSGPGEFGNMLDVQWVDVGREFMITDQSLSRTTRFTMDGELAGVSNYSEIRMDFQRFQSLGSRRFLAQGRRRGSMEERLRFSVYAFMDDRLRKTGDFLELDNDVFWQERERSWSAMPYAPFNQVVPFPNGRILVARPGIPRLSVYSTMGDLLSHIERDWPQMPITGEEKELTRERYRSRGLEEAAARVPFPEQKPFWGLSYTDTEGRIWLRRYDPIMEPSEGEEPGQPVGYEYEVFSAEGIWLGVTVIGNEPSHITDRYYYHRRSTEAGAPQFVRMRIVPLIPEMEPSGGG